MICARNTIKVNFTIPPMAVATEEDASITSDTELLSVPTDSAVNNVVIVEQSSCGESSSPSSLHLSKQLHEICSLLVPISDRKPGQAYFLVSIKWYSAWHEHVRNGCVAPGAINNWDLINNDSELIRSSYKESNYQRCKYFLRSNLIETRDFVCVPLVAWDALRHWYGGGPPLPRIISHADAASQPALQLYPAGPMSVKEVISGDIDLLSSAGGLAAAAPANSGHVLSPLASTSSRSIDSDDGVMRNVVNSASATATNEVKKKFTKAVERIPRVLSDCGKTPVGASTYCFTCRNPSRALKCSRCSAVYYCGRDCQAVMIIFDCGSTGIIIFLCAVLPGSLEIP